MEHKFSPLISEPAKPTPEVQQEILRIEARQKQIEIEIANRNQLIDQLMERQKAINKREAELIKTIEESQAKLNKRKLEKVPEEKKPVIEKKVGQFTEYIKHFGRKTLKYAIEKPASAAILVAATAGVAFGAVNFGGDKHKNESDFSKTTIEIGDTSAKTREFNEAFASVKEKVDTDWYKVQTPAVQKAYISHLVGLRHVDRDSVSVDSSDSTSVEDSTSVDSTNEIIVTTNDRAPAVATFEDCSGLVIKKHESGGNYLAESDSSSAAGAYQFLASWLKYLKDDFAAVGMDPNSDEAYDYFLHHPELQDKLFNIAMGIMKQSIPNFDPHNPAHVGKLFAIYYVGPEGAKKYGTPAGDIIPRKNGISINNCVRPRVREYMELAKKTKNPGWWVTDRENGMTHWVEATGKVTASIDVNKVTKNDRNDIHASPVGEADELEHTNKIVALLDKQLHTADYVLEHSKHINKKNKGDYKYNYKEGSGKKSTVVKNSKKDGLAINLTTKIPKGGF